MKFDNVVTTSKEVRRVALPLGSAVVGFQVSYCDMRGAEYSRIKSKINKPVRKLIEVDALPPEKDRELAVRAFVQACIRGWDGVTSDGQEVPYSEENCVDLLVQAPSLFYSLVDEATERDNFKPSENDKGN